MPSICPFAEWRPLPEATSQPAITPRVVIFHTMVGGLAGTEKHFRDNTGVESHFGVGGPTDGASLDGALWQWMDLRREADANLDANRFSISIETSDGGDPDRPWSAKQLQTLVRVGNWLADQFNIPRRQCPAWDASGFGWHVMFGAPSHWTPVAKVCPGAVRIRQLREVVLPAIFAGSELPSAQAPPPPPPPKERDMFILRCDQTAGTAGRQLRLVNGQRHRIITSAERAELGAEGVVEHDVTGHPGLYDDVLSLAETTASTWTDDQLQELAERLAPLVAGRITIEGHPTLNITGVAVPAPTDAS